MMACSYLSAGGLKSEPTSAACWSPPAMAGCLPDPRSSIPLPTLAMKATDPSHMQPYIGLPNNRMSHSGTLGLPRASMSSRASIPSQSGLASGLVGQTIRPMGLPTGSIGLPSVIGLSSGTGSIASIAVAQIGLPPPFQRPRSQSALTQGSAAEPALDLSTSAPLMTSSLKVRIPDKNIE